MIFDNAGEFKWLTFIQTVVLHNQIPNNIYTILQLTYNIYTHIYKSQIIQVTLFKLKN